MSREQGGRGGEPERELVRPELPRVFCVGLNKTGTSSMKLCFQKLGFTPVGSPSTIRKAQHLFRRIVKRGDYGPALRQVPDYVSFEDRPWNVREMYRHLHAAYPGGKFILTLREPASWWRSVNLWLTEQKPHLVDVYKAHLRASRFREKNFVAAYQRYNEDVLAYFRGHDDFITMDLAAGDGWEKLCSLLDAQVPRRRFPHRNKRRGSPAEPG